MKDVVCSFLEKGFLVSPDFLSSLPSNFDENLFFKKLFDKFNTKNKPVVLNKDLFLMVESIKDIVNLNWKEFEVSKVLYEKNKDDKLYPSFLNFFKLKDNEMKVKKIINEIEKDEGYIEDEVDVSDSSVIVLSTYKDPGKKKEIKDFVGYFKSRYDSLKGILLNREELQGCLSIKNITKESGNVGIIGIISDITFTKNDNCILTLEDLTGSIKVLITKKNTELFSLVKDLVLDEVIGVVGAAGDGIVFSNQIYFPDIPLNKEFKKVNEDVFVAFTADLHIGSNMFFADDFLRFINWLNGEVGNGKQRELAKRVKYLFIVGDLVDGAGIYPDQDKELVIKDVSKQYEKCAEYLGKIRKDLKIVICAGNHDALRIAEPQPILNKDLAKSLYELPNLIMVTNPSLVNIHSSKDFPGFDILLYHGYSFQYFADKVESVRVAGGTDRTDLIMKFLLQKRHLAPSHTSTLYIPHPNEDPLLINKVPDFFVTGHMHRTSVINYRNVTSIGCGCWQGQTAFMEKVGVHPDPSRVSLINLKTREVKILNFSK